MQWTVVNRIGKKQTVGTYIKKLAIAIEARTRWAYKLWLISIWVPIASANLILFFPLLFYNFFRRPILDLKIPLMNTKFYMVEPFPNCIREKLCSGICKQQKIVIAIKHRTRWVYKSCLTSVWSPVPIASVKCSEQWSIASDRNRPSKHILKYLRLRLKPGPDGLINYD